LPPKPGDHIAVDRNRPGLVVLGLFLFDPDLAGHQIDLRSLDFAQFDESHAGMVGDYKDRSQVARESVPHLEVFAVLQKTLAHIVFL
jgi:hypothetical protein